MGKKSLSLSTGIKQEDVIHQAWKILLGWDKKEELSKILGSYQIYVYYYFKTKRKLKNPVNQRTGKPLKDSTLYQLRCQRRREQLDCEARKMLIKLFVFDGILGQPGKALTVRLEKYFKQLEGETEGSRLSFKFLIKSLDELKEKNSGKNYKNPERRLMEQCQNLAWEIAEYKGEIKYMRGLVKRIFGIQGGETENYNPLPKRKKRPDHNFKIIDGGRKFEEQPPFATQTPPA